MTVPAAATTGTQRISVRGVRDLPSKASATLPLDLRVSPTAAGAVTMTTDTPQLKGASDTSFKFTLTLTNDTPDDLTFSVVSTVAASWAVVPRSGQQAQAASVIIKAGASTPVSVTAKAASDTAAGTYPITVDATSGDRTAHTDLSVDITGQLQAHPHDRGPAGQHQCDGGRRHQRHDRRPRE